MIDASGRSQLLARKLGLSEKSEIQRAVFWMRIEDYEEHHLRDLQRDMREQHPTLPTQNMYDSSHVTHHFMGQGNWVWMIPLRPNLTTPRT